MTQTQINNLGCNRPSSSRRQFLRVAGAGTTISILVGLAPQACSQTSEEIEGMNAWTKHGKSYIPPNGFVPDRKTAFKVADAVLTAVYGEQQIAEERPLKIALVDKEIWMVWGTMDTRRLGGTAVIKMSKRTGEVIFLSHAQ